LSTLIAHYGCAFGSWLGSGKVIGSTVVDGLTGGEVGGVVGCGARGVGAVGALAGCGGGGVRIGLMIRYSLDQRFTMNSSVNTIVTSDITIVIILSRSRTCGVNESPVGRS
jgi:hypothetical protein